MSRRKKMEEYPPIVVAVILTLAFLIAGGIHICRAAALEKQESRIAEVVQEQRAAVMMAEATLDYTEIKPEATAEPEAMLTKQVVLEEATQAPEEPENQTLIASRDWDAEDSEILLRIAMAEAEGEPTEGKALVMLVVLNRVWSDGFPDSIEAVVMQHSGGCYQFSPVAPGGRYWTKEPNEDCYRALEMVMYDGWDESKGALFFESCTGESWQSRNCEYLFTVGNHAFYK